MTGLKDLLKKFETAGIKATARGERDDPFTLLVGDPTFQDGTNHEQRKPVIYFVDDDFSLYNAAVPPLVSKGYVCAYTDIREVNTLEYWVQLGITPLDLIVLDLNFSMAHDEAGQSLDIPYSGVTVMRLLSKNAGEGKPLAALSRVLVASSHGRLLTSPVFTQEKNIHVYTITKGIDPSTGQGSVQQYAELIPSLVERIYDNIIMPVNKRVLTK